MRRTCIIRNAEAETNSGLLRVVDALTGMSGMEVMTLTRKRKLSSDAKQAYQSKNFKYKNQTIRNEELQLRAGENFFEKVRAVFDYQKQLHNWLESHVNEYDIIHAFDMDSGQVALNIAKKYHKPFVYHIADFYADSRQSIPSFLYNYLKQKEFDVINQADVTIICTEERRQQIAGSQPKKLEVIHNSPIKRLESLDGHHNDQFTLSYVGNLMKRRFIDDVLDIAKNHPDIRLELAGFGELEDKAQDYADRYDNIRFYGQVSSVQALEIYQKTDLMFACYDPSVRNHRYSAPNKVYEAMMLAKPIIVANGTGINDLVESNQMGLSVDYNQDDFIQAVKKIKNNPALQESMSQHARTSYEQYSWDKMKAKIQKLYEGM